MNSSSILSRRSVFVISIATFLAISTSRILVEHFFASDLPFWDQWDSEGWLLLRAFQDGHLPLDVLFSAHNEHRIFFTRIVTLLLFIANNHQWDNLVSLTFNALASAVVFSYFAHVLMSNLPWRTYFALFVFFVLSACLPLSGENLLSGFQNQALFLCAMTAVGIWIASVRPPSVGWLTLLCTLAIASNFTLASGVATAPCFAFAACLRWWGVPLSANAAPSASAHHRGLRDYPQSRQYDSRVLIMALIILALAISIAGLMATPTVPGHLALRSKGLREFLDALVHTLTWPLLPHWWCIPLVWGPFLLGGLRTLASSKRTAFDIAAFALGGWVVLQSVAMAYARGHEMNEVPSRYWDMLVPGLLVNIYFLMQLGDVVRRKRGGLAIAMASLCTVYMCGLGARTVESLSYMQWRSELSKIQVEHVHHFVLTGDIADLQGKPPLHIPYPDPQRLAMMLRDQTIRSILPVSVRPGLSLPPNDGFAANGFYPTTIGGHISKAIGSYLPTTGNQNIAELSAQIATTFPYLAIDVAGYLGMPGLALTLYPADATPVDIRPREFARETWKRLYLAVSSSKMELRARDNRPDYWFAFTEPVEVGRLSMLTEILLRHSISIAIAVLILLTFAATLFLFLGSHSRIFGNDSSAGDDAQRR